MFHPCGFVVEDLESWPRSGNINFATPQVEKVQKKIVAIQVHQINSEDERRFIHGIGLETETNSWTSDASIKPTFLKFSFC
jgi:hypothetical protein